MHKQKKAYHRDLDQLKGLAILMVIACHSKLGVLFEPNSTGTLLVESLFLMTVVPFFVIGGFTFAFALANDTRLDFPKYLRKKAERLLLPYFVFSSAFVVLKAESLGEAAWFWLNGCMTGSYWFVPVMFLVLIIAPLLFHQFGALRNPSALGKLLLPLFVFSGLLGFNNWGDTISLRGAIFYLPYFLFGVWLSLSGTLERGRIKGLKLVVVFLLGAIFEVALGAFSSQGIPREFYVLFPKKVLLCLAVWSYLRLREKPRPALEYLGKHSYVLYFIQDYVGYLSAWFVGSRLGSGTLSPLVSLGIFPFVLMVSVFGAICLDKLSNRMENRRILFRQAFALP